MLTPLAISYTIQTTDIYEYPSGQFHYCFDGYNIAVKGFDGIVYTQNAKSKYAYGATEIYDSCHYLNEYFNKTSTKQCSTKNITENHFALLYKKGQCTVGVHYENNLYNRASIKALVSEIDTLLESKNVKTYESLYESDTDNIIYNYPLGTSHFCFDNTHITLSGYDNIVYGERTDSKYAYSFTSIQDSCFHSLKYFNQLTNKLCNFNDKTIHPIRSYGHCFISIDKINITIAESYQDYLVEADCRGCKNGKYYHIINYSSGALQRFNYTNILLSCFPILLGLYYIFIE